MLERTDTIKEEDLDEDTLKNKYLIFHTEHQLFGIPISDVIQIVGMQELTAVPDFPNYAKGLINLRGTIIPIIDMRIRLKLEEKKYDERTCIIITNVNDLLIGFIVDSVEEVAKINESNVSEPPKVTSEYIYTYITGIAKLNNDIILVLDLKKILSEKELELITNLF